MSLENIIIVVGLLAIGFLATRQSDPVQTMLVAGPSRLQSTMGPTLSGTALDAYRTWQRDAEHFGAFAANDFGDFGWVSQYNSIETAEATALAFCGVPDCRIVARSLPMTAPDDGQLAVSRTTAEAFNEFLALPGAKAFAVHGNGASGSWIGAGTLRKARQGAVTECERWIETSENPQPDGAPTGTCRVVFEAR